MIQLFRPRYEVEEILSDMRKVLSSGWTGPGLKCREFEESWKKFVGENKYFCHYLNSATAALHIAVRLLDLPRGSNILTSPLTFISTNAAILYENHVPVFCDIADDLSMDFEDAVKKIKEHNIKAVIWVHHSGNASINFDKLLCHKKELGIQIIEDGAHAGGGHYRNGKRIGSCNGNIYCASFQAVKNIPTFDGGLISVPDEIMLERVKKLAWMGINKDTFSRTNTSSNELYKWEYTVDELGWKYNGNDISATIANVQLKYADRDNAYRRMIYDRYCRNIGIIDKNKKNNRIILQNDGSSHHLVIAKVNDREKVMAALKANGFATGVHYTPNYTFPILSDFYEKGSCKTCEELFPHIVSLPNHLELTMSDVDEISEIINRTM